MQDTKYTVCMYMTRVFVNLNISQQFTVSWIILYYNHLNAAWKGSALYRPESGMTKSMHNAITLASIIKMQHRDV